MSGESVVFCLDSFFVERLVVFGPSEVMLVWADSHQVFNSVLLCKLCRSKKVRVFIRAHREVVMGEVKHILSTFEANID